MRVFINTPHILRIHRQTQQPSAYTVRNIDIDIYMLTAIGLTHGGSSTVQYRTEQYSTVQYSTVPYSTVQYSTHLHTNNTENNTINNFGWKAFWDSNTEWSN